MQDELLIKEVTSILESLDYTEVCYIKEVYWDDFGGHVYEFKAALRSQEYLIEVETFDGAIEMRRRDAQGNWEDIDLGQSSHFVGFE
ncbi:hypothetical protein [Laceyella putida]|uniref:PepSY domain-containing protein n=1 Tax=Laceyella putida TaxID=110101 RepID=A0ABW2RHH1_9BACL